MNKEIPIFPTIEFHDTYGYVHIVKEVVESTTFDGDKKVAYLTHEGEEFHFVIKEN